MILLREICNMRVSLIRDLLLCSKSFAVKSSFSAVRQYSRLIFNKQLSTRYPAQQRLSANLSTALDVYSHSPPKDMEVSGVPLSQILGVLNSFAPTHIAEKWDNVGLLVEPEPEIGKEKLISKILLTNDLTEDVLHEAVIGNYNMIISYHPPIFESVKRVTSETWKGRILQTCLRGDIAVYSPHTSWDAARGGVNDWLIQAFDEFKPESKPILQSFEINKHASHVAEAIVPKKKSSMLITTLRETLNLDNIGEIPYQIENGNLVKVIIPCKTKDILPLTDALRYFPHTFTKHETNPILGYGMGRSCSLGLPQTLKDIVEVVKKHLGVPDLSLALARGADIHSVVKTVAVCAGSGGHVLLGQKVDLFVTGEMSHHQVLDAVHQGISVILTRHSNSERGFLQHFLSVYLNKQFAGKVKLTVSSRDQDPLHTV